MGSTKITNQTELALAIMHLRSEKFSQEQEITHRFRELAYTFSPMGIAKNTLHNLVGDREVRFDLAKAGLNIGSTLLIDQVLGKYKSIGGFLGSIAMDKLSSLFIDKNGGKVVNTIAKLAGNFLWKSSN